MFHETAASHAHLGHVVDCFRGEMRHSRKAKRPSEQSQRGVRRPLGQSRAPAAPRKNTRLSQTQFLISFCLPNHTINSTDQVTTTSLRSSIALSPSLLPAWGLRAAQNPQGIPRAIASKPVPAEIICRWPRRLGEVAGRRSSLASLVADGCSLTLPKLSFFSTQYVYFIPR